MVVADLGAAPTLSYGQVAASGSFVAYPYANQTGITATYLAGAESPRVSATLVPNDEAGTPVIVNIRNADYVNYAAAGTLTPVVTAFTLTDSTGAVVDSAIFAPSTISGGSAVTVNADADLGAGFVVLVPKSPLTSGATYTANFSVVLKTGGTALAKAWSFTVQ
jgi:hypothetical protein